MTVKNVLISCHTDTNSVLLEFPNISEKTNRSSDPFKKCDQLLQMDKFWAVYILRFYTNIVNTKPLIPSELALFSANQLPDASLVLIHWELFRIICPPVTQINVTSYFSHAEPTSHLILGNHYDSPEWKLFPVIWQETATFLACGGLKYGSLDFNNFVYCFSLSTWLLIVTCALISAVIILEFKISSNLLILATKIFLEQDDPKLVNKDGKNYLYFVSTGVILSFVVITNSYKGDNIMAIASPLKPIRYKNLIQLVNNSFSIYIYAVYKSVETGFSNGTVIEFDYVESLLKTWVQFHGYSLSEKRLQFYERVITTYRDVGNVLGELFGTDRINCSNVAVVDWKHSLQSRYEQVMDGRYSFSLGEETIVRKHNGWQLLNLRDTKIVERITKIMESGILEWWQTFRNFALDLKNIKRRGRKFVPLILEGNIVTLFIRCGTLIALAGAIFCIEKVWRVMKIIFVSIITCKFQCQCDILKDDYIKVLRLGFIDESL